METEQLERIAGVAAVAACRALMDSLETQRAKANERIYTLKAIALEIGISERQLRDLIGRGRFPLDKDPRGNSVRRWELERWLEAKRVAVDHMKRGSRKEPNDG